MRAYTYGMNATGTRKRASIMADIFYPEDASAATAALESYDSEEQGAAVAIIAPHAGWDISGRVTGSAFGAASGRKVSTVVVIGPLHASREEGLFLSDSEWFETPIGDIAVDLALCEELATCGTSFVSNDIPHLEEHSIEILLPFIKRAFPEAAIVPILIGGSRPSAVKALSRSLDLVFGPLVDETLFIASTNLSAHMKTAEANHHADEFLRLIRNMDGEGTLAALAAGKISACGAAACAALLGCRLLSGTNARVVSESSSDRKGGASEKLVRYAAVAFE